MNQITAIIGREAERSPISLGKVSLPPHEEGRDTKMIVIDRPSGVCLYSRYLMAKERARLRRRTTDLQRFLLLRGKARRRRLG